MMIPPFLVSCSSSGRTSTRSPSGLTLTVAISWFFLLWFLSLVEPATVDLRNSHRQIVWLLLLVFVHDFELRVDDVAVAAFRARTLVRAGLATAGTTIRLR